MPDPSTPLRQLTFAAVALRLLLSMLFGGLIGLRLGAGFYEGAVLTTALILVAELIFSRMEYRILDHVPEINLYLEYADKNALEAVLRLFRDRQVKVLNMEITRISASIHSMERTSTLLLQGIHCWEQRQCRSTSRFLHPLRYWSFPVRTPAVRQSP